MTHQVTALNHVNGNATGVDGILQNVAFILSTFALPCPLRNYGMKPFQRLKK